MHLIIKYLKYIILLNLNYIVIFSYHFLMKNLNLDLSVTFFCVLGEVCVISLNFRGSKNNFLFIISIIDSKDFNHYIK